MIKRIATVASVAVATSVAAVLGAGSARAAGLDFAPCHGSSGVLCASVNVPLDWSGAVPGSVPLAVEELPAKGTPRGVMMLLAGGPGQASAQAFDLSDLGSVWQSIFPGYTLVAFDPRGTGDSGFLACSLGSDEFVSPAQVTACGVALGPSRVYYTTAANAEDVEAVRQAMGVDKLGLWGTSYGTKVALAYAQAHPDHVERMLLDSVVPVNGPDPFALETLQGIPLALNALCGSAACRAIAPDLAGEVATLANRASVTPIRGRVLSPIGRRLTVTVDGETLLGIVVTADLNPGLQALLPSAIQAAVAGRPQALLRIAAVGQSGFRTADSSFSAGLFLATICADGLFPWQPNDDGATRQQALTTAIAGLPAGSTGPFGSWATEIGPADYCRFWPSPSGNAPLVSGPLPDVPVLALSGTLDMRTPTVQAAAIVSQFPQGHLLVVPGVGHSVLTVDPSRCAENAVKLWLDGGTPPARCVPVRPYLADVPRIPATIAKAPIARGASGVRGKLLSAAESSVQDALAAGLTAGRAIGGLAGGKASAGFSELDLTNFSDVPGVSISGTLHVTTAPRGALLVPEGPVTVRGPRHAEGVVTYSATGRVTVRWTR